MAQDKNIERKFLKPSLFKNLYHIRAVLRTLDGQLQILTYQSTGVFQ